MKGSASVYLRTAFLEMMSHISTYRGSYGEWVKLADWDGVLAEYAECKELCDFAGEVFSSEEFRELAGIEKWLYCVLDQRKSDVLFAFLWMKLMFDSARTWAWQCERD
jgi:hypothetical protein